MKTFEITLSEKAWAERAIEFLERHMLALFCIHLAVMAIVLLLVVNLNPALADSVRLPGQDVSSQMESAGTLLRFIDTGIFQWTARILAGLCIFGAGWSLKEMRFGPAVIAVVAAILFGTAPTWVKNIFSIGGSNSVFSQSQTVAPNALAARVAERSSNV